MPLLKFAKRTIVSFVLVLLIVNVTIVLSFETRHKTQQSMGSIQITNFERFVIKDDSDQINSINSNHWIYFKNNQTDETQAIESYFLDFAEFGNVTDVQIDLLFNYSFNVSNSGGGIFGLNLITSFDISQKKYTHSNSSIGSTYFYNYHPLYKGYLVESFFYEGFPEYRKYMDNFPLNDTLNYQIRKTGRILECKIKDSNNNTILSHRYNSEFYYVNGLIFWYAAFKGKTFTVNITSINANLKLEVRDWEALAFRDKVLYSTIGVFSGILLVTLIFLISKFIVKTNKKLKLRSGTKEKKVLNEFKNWEKEQEKAKTQKLDEILFTDKAPKDSLCSICKLVIAKESAVLRCPKCSNFFHSNHLIYWLEKNKGCPICKEEFLLK